ncbi:MAG: hypothetical protein K2P68_08700 [Sphingomonas sp.]|nr:hypothetical protein [Sphingomonas sp.]
MAVSGDNWSIADIASDPQTGQFCGMRHPEARFVVEVTADDEIVCRAPKLMEQRIKMADLAAVYVETNDSGPWGADVWWLLNDNTGQTQVAFPQLATGEEAALERLRLLPGFEVRGMNSGENARFMCWLKPCALRHDDQ